MTDEKSQRKNAAMLNTIIQGDAHEVLKGIPADYFDSCVTDPPYELGFMGKAWDSSGVAYSVDLWREVLRVLKPGAHLLSFGSSRTHHRLFCAIEDAGFEIRDTVCWLYGSGFPKSLDISKAIDKAAGAEREKIRYSPRPASSGTMAGSSDTRPWIEKSREAGYHEVAGDVPATDAARQWQGWGTALKPAHEPICVARKPFKGTVASNVLQHGTGGLNIDGGRVEAEPWQRSTTHKDDFKGGKLHSGKEKKTYQVEPKNGNANGRFPANVIHDGSEEVVRLFPETESNSGTPFKRNSDKFHKRGCYGAFSGETNEPGYYGDNGSAARFFYTAKASRSERGEGNFHPTVKPLALIQYLVKLVTPPGGIILDPFFGSGTLGIAAGKLGMKWVGIEKEAKYIEIAERRIEREVGLLLDCGDCPGGPLDLNGVEVEEAGKGEKMFECFEGKEDGGRRG